MGDVLVDALVEVGRLGLDFCLLMTVRVSVPISSPRDSFVCLSPVALGQSVGTGDCDYSTMHCDVLDTGALGVCDLGEMLLLDLR